MNARLASAPLTAHRALIARPRLTSWRFFAWLIVLSLGLQNGMRGQFAAQPETSPAPTPAVVQREIYTPYEQLEKIFENQGRGVFLPYKEFLDLWNKLNLPAAVEKNEPPVDGVLASARYTGKVEGENAVIEAQLELEALKEGWSKIAIGGADLPIAEAKSNAILHLIDGGGGYEVVFPAKGKYEMQMTLLGKISRQPGANTLRLRLPRAAASQVDLTFPETGLEFQITPAGAFSTREEGGATRLLAVLGASQDVTLSWKTHAAASTLPPLLFAETELETTVSPGSLRTEADIDLRVMRSTVEAVDFLVPAGQQVLSAEGAPVKDWTLAPGADGKQKLSIHLNAPVRDHCALRVSLEAPVAALPAKLAVPSVEVLGAERQSGAVLVNADPALTVALDPREGVTQQALQADANPQARQAASTTLGKFRFLKVPFAIDLNVQAAEPVVEVASATLLTVEPDTLGLRSRLTYTVKKAGIFSARIELPARFAGAEARGDAVESSTGVPPATPGADQELEVHFRQRQLGTFSFEVIADSPRAKPDEPVAVSVPKPVKAARHEGAIGVAVHQSLDVNTTGTGDLRQEDINRLDVPAPTHPDQTPLTLGFRFRGNDVKPAPLTFTLRKPRVSAELVATIDLRETLVRYRWRFNYHIDYAGVDEFTVSAPGAIADDLQFTGSDVKERVLTEEKDAKGAATGRKLWRISLQQKKLGDYQMEASVERPLPAISAGQTAAVDWPELRTVGLFRETGQVAASKDGNLEITRATPAGLEAMDPKELNLPSAENRQPAPGDSVASGYLLAYKYAAPPAALKLEFSKNEFLPVPSALVTYAVLNTVVAADRAETTEVIYWVRNNAQQYLGVALPEKGQMLSDVFVDGQSQQPSRRPDKNELLVRLPARSAGGDARPFSVRFVYRVPSPKPGSGLWPVGSLQIQPPVLADVRVLQTQDALYLPAAYRYSGFSGPMREVYARPGWNRLRGWLDRLVPYLGPGHREEVDAAWQSPPELPASTGGGFDSPLPKEGTPIILRRLDAPAPVSISFRSDAWANTWQALAFFFALGCGLALLGTPGRVRLGYFLIVGIGALIIAGAVAPRSAGFWTALYLGAFLAAVVWGVAGVWRGIGRLIGGLIVWKRVQMDRMRARWRRPPPPSEPPPTTPPASEAQG